MSQPISNLKELDENIDIIHNWEPLEFEISKEYEFIPQSFIFKILSFFIYYIIAAPILTIVCKLFLGLKIKGKENIKNIKTGAITVSNHIHYIDCAMIALAFIPQKIYFTTNEDNFKIPFIRYLIKILNAIPIPKRTGNLKRFSSEINNLLNQNEIVHFYPEAALWPYYDRIRNFKSGAFKIAATNNVPIIPIRYTYREPKGLIRFIKKKPFITLNILPPIYPDRNLETYHKTSKLKDETYIKMKNFSF